MVVCKCACLPHVCFFSFSDPDSQNDALVTMSFCYFICFYSSVCTCAQLGAKIAYVRAQLFFEQCVKAPAALFMHMDDDSKKEMKAQKEVRISEAMSKEAESAAAKEPTAASAESALETKVPTLTKNSAEEDETIMEEL